MEDELRSPGRPSGWHPSLGKGKSQGVYVPPAIIELLKEQEIKNLLSRIAIDPDFKILVLRLIDTPQDGQL